MKRILKEHSTSTGAYNTESLKLRALVYVNKHYVKTKRKIISRETVFTRHLGERNPIQNI